jgi:alpha-L-fucosidase 2
MHVRKPYLAALVAALALTLPGATPSLAQGIAANALSLRIGADNAGGNRFAGEIARAWVYTRALSASELEGLSRLGPGDSGADAALVGDWVLAEPDIGGYRDRSGHGPVAEVRGTIAPVSVAGRDAVRFGDGFLEVGQCPQLDNADALTLTAWIRPGELPANGGRIIDKITPGGTDGFLLDCCPGTRLRLIVGSDTLQSATALEPGRWVHVAGTATADGLYTLYVDGKRIAASAEGDGVEYAGRTRRPADPLTLWYRRPARAWTEALVIGNGRLGGMVYGGVSKERIALNEDTLWSGEPRSAQNPEGLAALPEVRRLLLEGRNREAHDLVTAKMLGPYDESYLPLGELALEFAAVPAVRDYRRELDLSTAIAKVRYQAGDATYSREVFASHPGEAIVTRLTCDKPGRISFGTSLSSQLRNTVTVRGNEVVLTGRCPVHLDAYHGGPVVYDDGPERRGERFEVRVRVQAVGGTVRADGNALRVEGADSVLLTLVAATSYNGPAKSPSAQGRDPSALCERYLAKVRGRSFEEIRAEHVRDYQGLFGRVSLDLGTGPNASLPLPDRLRRYRPGADPGLAALYFQFGRYLLISGSRPGTQPSNLQGIWNEDLFPAWASNWTLNCNAQINYWPVEVANLAECHLPLVDMTEELVRDGERTARVLYNARGWMVHHNTDLWRPTHPVAGDPVWSIFQVGGAWLCQHLWEHYAFSGDRAFLERIYPTLEGAARYFLDTMVAEPKHGWLVTAPDTNFENYFRKPGGEAAAVCMGPTASMQMVRALFEHCAEATRLLGRDPAFRAEVEVALPRLAPMQVSPRTGELQEWLDDWDHASRGNGQMLSLWGLICADQITPRGTPELARAVRKSLDGRKPWLAGVGSWTGAFPANAFARFEDGDMAKMVLDEHLRSSVNPNLSARFGGAKWEIDGNLGQTAAIAEMLLQSQAGEVSLLPALPSEWRNGSANGLRARGGFVATFTWRDGRLLSAEITSRIGGRCVVRSKTAPIAAVVSSGRRVPVTTNADGTIAFDTRAGGVYTLVPGA